MPKNTNSDLFNWSRMPGSARRYINEKNGETISRRQYLNMQRGMSVEYYREVNKLAGTPGAMPFPYQGAWSIVNSDGEWDTYFAATPHQARLLGRYYNELEMLQMYEGMADGAQKKRFREMLKDKKHPYTWAAFQKKWDGRKILVVSRDKKHKYEIKLLGDPKTIKRFQEYNVWPNKENAMFSGKL